MKCPWIFANARKWVHTVSFRILLSFIIITALINAAVLIVSYQNTISLLKSERQENVFSRMDLTERYIKVYRQDVQRLALTLSEIDIARRYGEGNNDDLQKLLEVFVWNNIQYIDAIHFIGLDGEVLSTEQVRMQLSDSPMTLDAYKGALDHATLVYWTEPYETRQKDIRISCSRTVLDYEGNIVGVLILDTNFDQMNKMVEDLSPRKDETILLFDGKGLVVSSFEGKSSNVGLGELLSRYHVNDRLFSEVTRFERGIVDYIISPHEHYLIYYSHLYDQDYILLTAVDYNIFAQKTAAVWNSFITLNQVILIVIVLVAIWYAHTISAPLKRLTLQMNRVMDGDFTAVELEPRKDEIGTLSKTFAHLVNRIQELIREAVEHERNKKENDFKVLQAQINPHFLYNTLSSVNCMASMNRTDDIQIMISALINLLQASIDKMGEIITIEQELENLKNYVTIQQLRYGERFDVIYEVDEGILSFKLPKLLLQPLVENSIFHGASGLDEKLHIWVSVRLRESKIEVEVKDDGVGIDEKKIDLILSGKLQEEKGFTKIGVNSVNQRIQLAFGEEYGLTIKSQPGMGCTISFLIPFML